MAENSVSQVASPVKDITPIRVEFLNENTPAVRSDILAEHFNRNHKNVLRDIAKLRAKCPESFYGLNFEPVEYVDSKGEKRPAYLLTRNAFSLLVMGFTGVAAIQWKLRYIEAFNALENAIRENIRTDALKEHQRDIELARESGYQQGRNEALALPATQELMERIRLEGVKEGRKLQKRQDGYAMTMKAIGYLQKGLTVAEAAKLCDLSKSALEMRLRRLRSGMASLRRAKPVQGNLMEAGS